MGTAFCRILTVMGDLVMVVEATINDQPLFLKIHSNDSPEKANFLRSENLKGYVGLIRMVWERKLLWKLPEGHRFYKSSRTFEDILSSLIYSSLCLENQVQLK